MVAVEKGHLPELRFPGFKGDWREGKIIEFCPLQRGFDLPVSSIISGKYPVVFSNGILKTHNEYKAIAPGVVTGRSGTIGKVTFVEENYWPHNTSLWVTDFKDNDPKFIYFFLLRLDLTKFSTGSGVPTLNRNDVHVFKTLIPKTKCEQQKIAAFLGAVDDKLTALRRKRELLQDYKRGMMQKIFSRDLRFKRDDGSDFPDWEEKTVGDFMAESTEKGSKGDGAKKITVKLWGKGVFAKEEKMQGSVNTQYYRRRSGQFIYSKLDFLNCAFGIIPDYLDGFETTVDLPCFDIEDGINRTFILEYIKQKSFYKKYGETADGSRKAKRIHANIFLRFPVNLPCIAEQQKIADFLSAIDAKIEAVAKQIEKVETFKKGLLQKMFV